MKVRLLGTPTSCGFTFGAEYEVKDFDIKTGDNELCDGAWIDNEFDEPFYILLMGEKHICAHLEDGYWELIRDDQ